MQTVDSTNGKRMVALCDYLGFSRLIMSKPLDKVLSIDIPYLRRLAYFCLKHENVPADPPPYLEYRDNGRVGFAWFSDTILVYAQDDCDDSCYNVIETVKWLLLTTFDTATPIRAGIAYDEFFADPSNELYLGRAMVEAHELEQSQDWIGAALTHTAIHRLPQDLYGWPLREYRVPLKEKAKPCGNIVVDWTDFIHNDGIDWTNVIERERVYLSGPSEKDTPESEDWKRQRSVYLKLRNARLFHNAVCTRCFPENNRRRSKEIKGLSQ